MPKSDALSPADAVVSLNHFKGHELLASRRLKTWAWMREPRRQNSGEFPIRSSTGTIRRPVRKLRAPCDYADAQRKAVIDHDLCTGFSQCVAVCQFPPRGLRRPRAGCERISEYTEAILNGSHYVNFVMNVSQLRLLGNDAPVVADIGISRASAVALDQPVWTRSTPPHDQRHRPYRPELRRNRRKVRHIHPDTDWSAGLDHAVRLGIGNRKYDLVKV